MEEKRHYAVIDPLKRKLVVEVDGKSIVETTAALSLKEVGKSVYDPVYYVPKEDILVKLKKEDGKTSHCPIKGDAVYWQIEGQEKENYFAWSYEEPLSRAKKIEGYVAFNPDYVTFVSKPNF